jgi:hypothetical protein
MIDRIGAAQGLEKGTVLKSQGDAVKWRLLERTVTQTREAFASLSDGELRDTIDKAVLNVRKQKGRGRGRSRKMTEAVGNQRHNLGHDREP